MAHTFHIPVMGLGFTLDSPVKVAKYGIDSVISLADDILIEQMRENFCNKFNLPFQKVTKKMEDFRAKRITMYLNLVNNLATKSFEKLKDSLLKKGSELQKYIDMLPDMSEVKMQLTELQKNNIDNTAIKNWLHDNLRIGSIDVNIMTKLDKTNFIGTEQLPQKFNDAHAALRGFANSDVHSSIVLSAGLNPRLYGYFEEFEDFYPNDNNYLIKKITIKVSDYRSAIIQGKYFAKKGLWVSEYRIESGLNCGGHAFATDGHLLGKILEEFNTGKDELKTTIHQLYTKALKEKNRHVPEEILPITLSVQGGVGTAEEHSFLLDYYKVDSVGWGSPFLLVPEVTSLDDRTRVQLKNAKEKDLYLSDISPFGIPFNSIRIDGEELSKKAPFKGTPGSSCPKKFLVSNTEFTKKPICTASSKYMKLKIAELDTNEMSEKEYDNKHKSILQKACLCMGLGTSTLRDYGAELKKQITTVCPGPNLAYFSEMSSLKNMASHIYGKESSTIKVRKDRPNIFIKELSIYVNYIIDKLSSQSLPVTKREEKYYTTFIGNINAGIDYYKDMFNKTPGIFDSSKDNIIEELNRHYEIINAIKLPVVPEKVT